MNCMNIRKSISLPKELWEKIDKLRNDIHRSAFINKILKNFVRRSK